MFVKILLALFLIGSVNAHADIKRVVESIVTTDTLGGLYTTIAVGSQATVFTKSFSVTDHQYNDPIGVMYKATSSGTINLSIIPEQSYGTPTSEISGDVIYVPWDTTVTVNDTGWHATTLDTVIFPRGRFKIVGGSGNSSSTTVQIKVGK